jgi:hypothetical protein
LEEGNNCFINPETLVPYKDQWAFLQDIQRVSVTLLDQLYEQILKTTGLQKDQRNQQTPETGKIRIELDQSIKITRDGLSLPLINFLKDELNFPSSEYVIKKKLGKSTWNSHGKHVK